jgi:hypothetical protein
MSDTVASNEERVFEYDGKEFRDPGSQYSNKDVLDMLAQTFGALRGGKVEVDGNRVILKPAPKHLGQLHTVYTFGYSGQSPAELAKTARELEAIVVDVRHSPHSRRPDWRKGALLKALGGNYLHVPELGNINYKGTGGIQIADLDKGLRLVWPILESASVILLCVCASHVDCHRAVVAAAMNKRWGVEVVHLDEVTLEEAS